MPAARAASSREDPSSTRARASIRRAARASRHRPASRRSSAAPSSSRVIATVMAPSADRPHRRSTASGATRLRARQHVRNSGRWYHIYAVLREFSGYYHGKFSILEFGTSDGYSFTKMLFATRYLKLEDRVVVHGCDSFEGMPPAADGRDRNIVDGVDWVEGE